MAKCRYAECRYADCHLLALYAECRYAECRYAECRYAEGLGPGFEPPNLGSSVDGSTSAQHYSKTILTIVNYIQ
jgi:hypothetical protein